MLFRRKFIALASVFLLGVGFGGVTLAQTETSRPHWAALNAAQQTILSPVKADWPSLDAPRKQKWLAFAKRYPQLSPAEQARAQERMKAWASLSPKDRQAARDNFMVAQADADLAAKWDAYQQLPPEKKAELAERARAAKAAQSAAPAVREKPLKLNPPSAAPAAQ